MNHVFDHRFVEPARGRHGDVHYGPVAVMDLNRRHDPTQCHVEPGATYVKRSEHNGDQQERRQRQQQALTESHPEQRQCESSTQGSPASQGRH